jgi:cytochrome P450
LSKEAAVAQPLVQELVERFDHHDPRLGDVSHDVYRSMRAGCPVAHSDEHGGFWIVNGYAAAREAYQRYDVFSAHPTVNIPAGLGHVRPMLPFEVDPPVHKKYRGLLAPVFAPGRIDAMEPEIRRTCNELIDTFVERGHCDVMTDLGKPLPGAVFTSMMGLPAEEAGRFIDWNHVLIHGHADDPDNVKRPEVGRQMQAYLADLLEQRKRQRGDDLISVLLDAEIDGEKLTDEELLDEAYALFLGGLDTIAASIGLHFLFLATHPAHRDRLVAHPELIPSAVEELLRYESLILTGRTVTQDLEFHGVQMRKGDRVLLNSVSAGRDEDQFPAPDEVLLDRPSNRHLAFGVGPHRCVGSHLARLELRVVHECMHERVPGYRLREGAVVTRHASSVAGVDRVPLVWDT